MKALIVSKYTFKELIKSKVMVLSVWASVTLFLVVYIASEFSYGNPQKIALDFGLGTSSILSAIIAIFLGGNLIRKEVDNRTIYIALSRPIDRLQFLLGKISGLSLILFLNVFLINSVALSVYAFYGGGFDWLIIIAIIFSLIESLILLLVVIFFSLFTNQTISVVNTAVIYILGHAIPRSFDIHFLTARPALLKLVKGYSYIFPNLDKLNIKDFVLYNKGLDSGFIIGSASYGFVYCLMLLFVSTYIFNRKELE